MQLDIQLWIIQISEGNSLTLTKPLQKRRFNRPDRASNMDEHLPDYSLKQQLNYTCKTTARFTDNKEPAGNQPV